MIERARENADGSRNGDQRRPSFLVGDVASLAFPDRSFDLVVSTLSMHHWADPTAAVAEIGRVLRPGGGARVGLSARSRPLPGASARSCRTCARLIASGRERDAMALALEV
jgi:ubiquinone/menaquinone biosynthesis C-methylase UbiE